MRIIFMGTPDFAVPSLKKIVEAGYDVVAVVTMPDKPIGRGHKVQFSPVKEYALSVGIPVLQPDKLKDPAFIEELRSYNADLQVVVAFRMLPEVVWSMPKLGTFNLHAALLPQYRGAAPLNWAIINGEKQTGLTTFMLKHEIDTGDMMFQEHIDIGEDENVGSVHDRLMVLGADLVLKTIKAIENNEVELKPQPELSPEEMKPAPKIFKETCEIDFNKTSKQVHDFVRGLSPYPTAWTRIKLTGEIQDAKIYATKPYVCKTDKPAGILLTDYKNYIRITTLDGYVEILELQLPAKKRMKTKDLLNGIRQ